MDITSAEQKFILHWGEMGTRWGINRTVAQIHALLFISPKGLHAEEISETLKLARSTVSAGLKELQAWGIIKIVHVMGDRRDHFESIKDVMELFRIVLDERKRREMDPTLAVLKEVLAEMEQQGDERESQKKIAEIYEFLETMLDLYGEVQKLPSEMIMKIAKSSGALSKLPKIM